MVALVGPRGDQGDRGQRGDQGQRGDPGAGERGPRGLTGRSTSNFWFYLFVMGVLVVSLGADYRQDRRDEAFVAEVCQGSATNREAIRDSLKRGFTGLGYVWDEDTQEPKKVGPPALSYWKEHPEEVPGQLDRLRQELDGFPPINCD